MEGSTRHEGQPLNPNSRDPFDTSENLFAFSPGQLSKLLNPKSLQAFYTLGGLEGLERGLRADRDNGRSYDEVASDRNVRTFYAANTVSTSEEIGANAVNQTTAKRLSQDGNLDTTEGKLAIGGPNRRNISGTKKPGMTPKLSPFSTFRKTYATASVLTAVSVMVFILEECHHSAGVNLPLPEQTLLALGILFALLALISIQIEDTLKDREFKELNSRALARSRLWQVRFSGKSRSVLTDEILIDDAPLLEPGDLIPADGVFFDVSKLACGEFRLTRESNLLRKTARHDLSKVLNEPHRDEGLKRGIRMDPFILPGSWGVDGSETCLNTAVGQHTRSRPGLSSLSGPTPIKEGIVHRPELSGSGFIFNCFDLFGSVLDIILSLLCFSSAPTRLAGNTKNGPETTWEIDFKDCCHAFISLALLIITCPKHSFAPGSHDPRMSSVLMLGVSILQHRRRLKPVLNRIQSLYQSVVSNVKSASPIDCRHRRQTHWKSALTLLALLPGAPVVAVAWGPVRALRIASGVTATSAATAVIPLRTIDGVPSWAWISDYAVWMMCFTIYLTLQVHHIPHHRDHRRQLYLFLVILLAIHFAIALAQSSPTLIDGFTIFGPMVLTITTFLMALLFGAIAAMEARARDDGGEQNASGTSHHPTDIAMGVVGMCA